MHTSLLRGAAVICLAMAALVTGACGRTANADPVPVVSGTAAVTVPSPSPDAEDSIDAPLPEVPAPWTVVQPAESAGGRTNLAYTRPGGPDLWFQILSYDEDPSTDGDRRPVATVSLGSYRGYVYPTLGTSHEVRWRVGDFSYRMIGVPGEGDSLGVAEFKQVISQLRWP
ncbi:hypothetical protein [Catellatospora sp. NPDC049609]|uniref:hypothetical protein n=1 Tax=Catellatospora sp. NPDC049609 TaxID=3155505 RepID=UPI00341AEED2